MLDEVHEAPPTRTDDENIYVLGSIQRHNVVIACLPDGRYGNNNAAIVVTNMKRTFPSIRACFMVGIGGGVPGKVDVRLGDIVVGTRVMQFDFGKARQDGELQRTAIPSRPDQWLMTAVSSIRSKHEFNPSRVPFILQQKLEGHPAYGRPSTPDRLFVATYNHSSLGSCDECDQSKLIPRSRRSSDPVRIHYGAIASGNLVMKDSITRDKIARELDVICFEMETAGLMDIFPCLPIRGICDYSDSHKSKEWQRYAAATAAAYARELLEELPVTESHTKIVSQVDIRKNAYYPEENFLLTAAYTQLIDHFPSDNRRQRILKSLKFEQMDSRETNIKPEQKKTCRWLLQHPSYGAWLDPAKLTQHHGFLWISGKPGAGKSTIMKFAYSNMKSKARQKHAITTSFFFNARGDALEKSISGMYRSLLRQLLTGYPDLQVVLDDTDLVPEDQDVCPSLNVLKELFASAVCALGQRPLTCFVDALDECDEQQVVDLVQYFEDLAEQSTAKGVPFRVCFSSRHYPYIVIKQGIRLTLEDQSGHEEDLATYVASRLRVQSSALAERLKSELLGKAAGVFMWVVLVVDILNKEYRKGGMAMRTRLAEIPSDLSELFKDILRRDSDNMEGLLLCILWILYAKNPLKPQEFHHAIWSGLSMRGLADSQIPEPTVLGTDADFDEFNIYVIGSSKGLAEITKSSQPAVQFIHESVRDFLIKDKGLFELWPELGFDSEGIGHEKLKQCCELYMSHPVICTFVSNLLSQPSPNERSEISKKYPFLEYASQNILHHANGAAKVVPQEEFLSSFPICKWIESNNIFEKFKNRKFTPSASLFYILADKGFSELIRTRLKRDPQIHVHGERYKYPLFAALANGNKDTIAALLNLSSTICDGVDITDGLNHRKDLIEWENRTPLSWAAQSGRTTIVKLLLPTTEIDMKDGEGETALSRASKNGHELVARLLIEKGANINADDGIGRTPLHLASEKGHELVARLLMEKGANLNTIDKYRQTPLYQASANGHELVARLLIEKGANLNTIDKYGQTPLYQASANGHELVAKLLIKKGADVNAKNALHSALARHHELVARLLIDKGANLNTIDKYGQTPLHLASANDHGLVTRLLIEEGADVNASDGFGRTPLRLASAAGHELVVGLLIEKGADVNAIDMNGKTPLHLASEKGHELVARLLIEKGADIHTSADFGQTPLHLASATGHELVVGLLIEKGADVNAIDMNGKTPLHLASEKGHGLVTRLLIEEGADFNASDGFGRTPLHLASATGHELVARLLIENRANINASDNDRETPLHLASVDGHELVARLLIEKGADINASDNHGWTPLYLASAHVHDLVVRLLIDNGAQSKQMS
ncbi:hypothetical protein N7490_011827 [Penicillium lividum]|nr:hypothetical protein N7490_011827 [Penicillium lividum]